ncbi:hypothetical protein Sste5346_009114 [Sporothrix stenoceras]|uniref:Pyrroloquinoline quinone-dependent pyranose dehydrogenase beta-propeller domain-containing protein n=1 Tax=Sporothrix stenoceras TaxID=5173 RepID=A0ABR3YLD3_9PEZI
MADPGPTLPSICPSILTPSYSAPIVAPGWTAQLVVTGLLTPRSLLFDDAGALLVVESGTGIQRITFDDYGDTCLVVRNSNQVVDQPDLNHSLEFSAETGTLYASSSNNVYAWDYDSSTGTASLTPPQTLVTGMDGTDHVSRTLLLSRDDPGKLIVSRGSYSNNDQAAVFLLSGHSQIRAFDITSPAAGNFPYSFTSGNPIGFGLRNSVGIAEEPTTNALYSVENSIDDIVRNGVDVHDNNPGEELNYHGPISQIPSSPSPNFGYPSCFALWDPTNFPDLGTLTVGEQFSMTQSTSLNDQICASSYVAPRLTFQAHQAPLDIIFTPSGSAAYVSFHGSWDRSQPVGYKVSEIAFSGGQPVAASDSTTSTNDILSNADLSVCPGQCFRPVGLAMDSKGRIFVSSDTTGEIYVLQKTPATTGGGSACRPNKARKRRGVYVHA